MVSDCISKLQDAKLIPKVIICDQDACHRSMFAKFKITILSPNITINNEEILFMYDTPHLIKSIRNNFMKHYISIDNSICKWEYIEILYTMDTKMSLRFAPKLTDEYIYCNTFDKMRVKLATQVLSKTVAAAIETYSTFGALPSEAISTAKFINKMDMLFDLFNSNKKQHFKPTKCAFTSSNLTYLKDLEQCIHSLVFVGTRRTLPCIEGWKLNISCLKCLWQHLHEKYDY